MPLLKDKENVGRNIEEMERAGHPHKQAVAAALRTAKDNQPVIVTQSSAGAPQVPKWKGRVV